MPGIYLHIPFCIKKCHYCDFYSITNQEKKTSFINALLKEIEIQQDYLSKKIIHTIYFGGGTPSILTSSEIEKILTQIKKYFLVDTDTEITFEANPDDLNIRYLEELKKTGTNRLSIGLQSFNDKILLFLNRRHNTEQGIESIKTARKAGFKNISIDLIYGIPGLSIKEWRKTIEKAIQLNIEHISAYHLTIEPQTVFGKMQKKGMLSEVDEEQSWKQFNLLIDILETNGFKQYEISNFAKNDMFSRHNSSYWKQEEYLGLGPSAHSYNLKSRQWNTSSVNRYIQLIKNNKPTYGTEKLSGNDKYNDYILTRLRTVWGIDLTYIRKYFGIIYSEYCIKQVQKISNELIIAKNKNIILTRKGMFQSNTIISELIHL